MGELGRVSEIKSLIIEVRGQRVILDRDPALIYNVPTKRLMEQVKRNLDRFPVDFMFRLTDNEAEILRSQFATSSWGGYRVCPYVFTRNGANMVSAILRSPQAIHRSVQIMRAFSALEELLANKRQLTTGSPNVLNQISTHSRAIMQLFKQDKVKSSEIAKIRRIIREMIGLLQQLVFKIK
jgi:hypothetical protein